ncbi:MAG: TetR/AcrR family transcriptional regulator [Rhodobacteraceae bacterium]|nr:TetR/AcrR family transcriptional regulator [Paracoccaceae bacterium]
MARKSGSSAEKTRPLVQAAAKRLFARHGYAAVSMRQIAAEVGVQAGALYLYTPDKQGLLFGLLNTHMEEVLAAWAVVDPGGNAGTRLQAFVEFHIPHHLERLEAVFISYMELRNLTPENFATIEALRRSYENRLEDILKAGVSEGRYRLEDTKLTTMAIIAMLNGVNTWYKESGRFSREQVVEIYVDMVKRAVGVSARE